MTILTFLALMRSMAEVAVFIVRIADGTVSLAVAGGATSTDVISSSAADWEVGGAVDVSTTAWQKTNK